MGLELASSTLNYFLISLFELLFIAGALLYYKFKKKNLKEEFINIISPKKLTFKAISIDVLLGLTIGIVFHFIIISDENDRNYGKKRQKTEPR